MAAREEFVLGDYSVPETIIQYQGFSYSVPEIEVGLYINLDFIMQSLKMTMQDDAFKVMDVAA